MKTGIVLTPTVDSWKTVKRAEELGFDRAWFFDSQMMYADVFIAMALCADRTERIELASGVVVPSNRIHPVTANAVASLEALAPGRIILGLGTGYTGRNTMGMGPMRLRDVEEAIGVYRALLSGEDTMFNGDDGHPHRIKFMRDQDRFGKVDMDPRIFFSGMGPKSMALTAKVADGWMAFAPGTDYALQYLQGITATCEAAGRDLATLPLSILGPGCILEEGEDPGSDRAMDQAGPMVAVFFHNLMEGTLDFELPPELKELADRYRGVYDTYEPADARYLRLHYDHLIKLRPEEREFINGDLIKSMTFTGTKDELREQLTRMEDAGCEEFGVQLMAGHEDEIEGWAEVLGLTAATPA